MNNPPKKSLGQHWLNDESVLVEICQSARLNPDDTVLEIGPGEGALTKHLVKKVKRVVAVELDESLSQSLAGLKTDGKLEIINKDILKFDFGILPPGYKIVANIPYYLTGHLVRLISETANPPFSATLLVQKEVAERICALPGSMSVLSVSTQFYFAAKIGITVPARAFSPPPKVDSQVVHLLRRQNPLFETNQKLYFRIVKAGFAGRRKKLRSSLSAGLRISKPEADKLLLAAGINSEHRAQNLSLEDWQCIVLAYAKIWPGQTS